MNMHVSVSANEILASYDSSHTHGSYGNWVQELVAVAQTMKIEYHICAK